MDRIAQLRAWDAAYHADNAIVTDAAYDAFRDETKRLLPNDPYWSEVGSAPRSAWAKVRLGYPMGSLNKVQTPDEMQAWLASKNLLNEKMHVSLKADGISILLQYESGKLVRAATRGDGAIGEDITVNVRKMRGVTCNGPFTGRIRGEIVLEKDVFGANFKPLGYKNCRNAAGGAAKDLAGEKCHLLQVLSYAIRPDGDEELLSRSAEFNRLQLLGFRTAGAGTVCYGESEIGAVYDFFVGGERDRLIYEIDGLVVEVDNTDAREAMGETDQRPHGAVAFKFPHDRAETTLRDIVWQVGASGRITPVAVFDPVELAGATVRQATLHNVAYIYRLSKTGCHIGDTICVSRKNDVIPGVEALNFLAADTAEFSPPLRCPVCDTATVMQGEYLVCPNKSGCDAQTEGSIKRWITKVGIKDFGSALVEAVCQAGLVNEPADLYRLDVEVIAKLQLSGKKVGKSTATTALKNLHAKTCLPIHVLVGSLGIPMWSRSMVKLLVSAGYDTLGKMGDATESDLVKIARVETTKARAFVEGFDVVLPKITNLLAVGITIAPEATGSMKGSTVCLTGFRDPAMEAAIESRGGTMKSSVSKDLTFLVAKDPTGTSGKLVTARANGTKVVGIQEMWALLGGSP